VAASQEDMRRNEHDNSKTSYFCDQLDESRMNAHSLLNAVPAGNWRACKGERKSRRIARPTHRRAATIEQRVAELAALESERSRVQKIEL
jgi:hypothetical protein